MKLHTSVSSGFFYDLSPEDMLDEVSAAGLSHIELGMEHGRMLLSASGNPENLGQALRGYAADRNISISQGHLVDPDICTREGLDMLKTWLDLFHGAGIKAAVLHTTGADGLPYEEQLQRRSDAIRELVSHIEGTDMVICLENLFSKPMVNDAGGINALIDAAGGGKHLGICLDIGHLHRCNCHGRSAQTSREFVETAGQRLKALHIHDNHGVDDDHLFPFTPKGLDWKMFMEALSHSGYDGLFNLELPGEIHAPLAVRRIKLEYGRRLADHLLSEEFICG